MIRGFEASKIAISELSEDEVRFLCWYAVETINIMCRGLGDEDIIFIPAPEGVPVEDAERGTLLSGQVRDRTLEIMEDYVGRN